MTIDQLIESYTYARVSGSTRSLTDLDNKTKDIIEGLNHKLKKELDVIFAKDEYEARLRHIRNEKDTNQKS